MYYYINFKNIINDIKFKQDNSYDYFNQHFEHKLDDENYKNYVFILSSKKEFS